MNQAPGWIGEVYSHTGWLYLKLFENRIFFIDFWSVAHLWTGWVLLFLFQAMGCRRKWLWIPLILFLYELSEILFLLFALDIFRAETLKDQVTDMVVGLMGAFLAFLVLRLKPGKKRTWPLIPDGVALFSATTIAFAWVGLYGYKYNFQLFNSPGLNYWAFANWSAGGYLLARTYLWLKKRTGNILLAFPALWAAYFTILLGLEAFGYHVMQVREISLVDSHPLVFGLIHGSGGLHLYYLLFPLLITGLYEASAVIARRAKARN